MKSVTMQIKLSVTRPGLLSLHGFGKDRNFRQALFDQGFVAGEEVVIVSKEDYEMLLAGSGLGDKK